MRHEMFLTAAGHWPPGLQVHVQVQAADSGVVLEELTVQAIHRWVSAQSVLAGVDVRHRIDVIMTVGEGLLLQEMTAA